MHADHVVAGPARIDRQAATDFSGRQSDTPQSTADAGAEVVELLLQRPEGAPAQIVERGNRRSVWIKDVRRHAARVETGIRRLGAHPADDGVVRSGHGIQRGQVSGVVRVVGIDDLVGAFAMAVKGVPGEFTQRAAEPDLDVAIALPCVGEIHAVRLIDRNSLNLVPDIRAEREERHGGARAIGVRRWRGWPGARLRREGGCIRQARQPARVPVVGQTWPAPSAVCAAVLRKGLLAKKVFGRPPPGLTIT